MHVSNFELSSPYTTPLTELRPGEFGVVVQVSPYGNGKKIDDVVTVLTFGCEENVVSIHPQFVVWGDDLREYKYKPLGNVEVTIKAEEN